MKQTFFGLAVLMSYLTMAAAGPISSGGHPPADIYFYSHCASANGQVVGDVAGTTGYSGGTGPGEMPGLDGKVSFNLNSDPCASAWLPGMAHHSGSVLEISAHGSEPAKLEMQIGQFPGEGSEPSVTQAQLVGMGAQPVQLTCRNYNALAGYFNCRGSQQALISCANGWNVCW